jgi:hypothetical protein
MNHCETGQTTLSIDSQNRAWEHFWLGNTYQFSNQIPNEQSWTRTDPGWVLADNGYCQWAGHPPARIRSTGPTGEAIATPANSPTPTAAAGMNDGSFGVLVLLAAIAAGCWWWLHRHQAPDSNYHPLADMDTALPLLGSGSAAPPDELWIEEGEAIPEGYELVPDAAGEASSDRPKFERSPWLPDAMRDQIDAEVRANLKRIYPQTPPPAPQPLPPVSSPPTPPELPDFTGENGRKDGENFRANNGEKKPIRNYRVLPGGQIEVINALDARYQTLRLLNEGITSITELTAAVFGVSGGKHYSGLAAYIKQYKAGWEDQKS